MPGANCAIFGCTVSRNHVGVSILRIPIKDDEYSHGRIKAGADGAAAPGPYKKNRP